MAGWLWFVAICGGCGAGQRDDARGLMLVPPLGRCWARIGGVCQVMPPWFGSWFVPMPAPWCAYWCGAGWCGCNSLDGGAVCSACPPPGVGLFDGVIGLRTVVIHVPYKGVNPPAPVVMQGDVVSGYGFSPYRHGPSCCRCA